MVRVCHLQVLPIMSGVQRSMLESFKGLDRSRYELEVVCREAGPLTEELAQQQIPFHLVPSLDRPVVPWRDYRAYSALCDLFRSRRYDIVHSHSSKPGILARLAARRSGVPHMVHHVHAFAFHEYSPPVKKWIYGGIERLAAPWCERMLFVNREERDMVVERGWLPAERCTTIYNGVDLNEVHPKHRAEHRLRFRRAWVASEEEVVILFMGRLEYPKQPLILADIAARLDQLRPARPWRLAIAGSGEEEAALAAAVHERNLEHRVQMLGWQANPLGVLLASDVMLLTSLAEGLPRSLIEAQAAGLPIVASDAKGNREVVTPGTGFLCPPKDVEAYAESLARMIDSPELRQQFGGLARQHAETCFDNNANNRQLADVYEAMLAGDSARQN